MTWIMSLTKPEKPRSKWLFPTLWDLEVIMPRSVLNGLKAKFFPTLSRFLLPVFLLSVKLLKLFDDIPGNQPKGVSCIEKGF